MADTTASFGDRVREGDIELFRVEAQIHRAQLIEFLSHVEESDLRSYLELRLRDPDLTGEAICRQIGVSTVTIWKKLTRLRQTARERDIV
jgi:hypothetical protein